MKAINKEWCSITLMNRFKICLKFEFTVKQADLIMVGIKITDGIGFSLLGVTLGIDWKLTGKTKEL
tara:strand:- start:10579 stop:10776 length:198 start_codon:yes stop_codon:yes gene_type:complete